MKSIFYILFAGIDSGFLDLTFIKNWTERLILNSETPQEWLIDLTLCSDLDSAMSILEKWLSNSGETLDEGYGETLIGFLCLCLEGELISIEKFISEVTDVMDSYEVVDLEIEEILIRYYKNQILSDELQKSISNKFKKYRENSSKLYKHLTDYSLSTCSD